MRRLSVVWRLNAHFSKMVIPEFSRIESWWVLRIRLWSRNETNGLACPVCAAFRAPTKAFAKRSCGTKWDGTLRSFSLRKCLNPFRHLKSLVFVFSSFFFRFSSLFSFVSHLTHSVTQVNGWTAERRDGRPNGRRDERTDRQTDCHAVPVLVVSVRLCF